MEIEIDVARRERLLLVVAAAFFLLTAVTLYLSYPAFGLGRALVAVLAWVLCFGSAHVVLSLYLPDRDALLLPIAALLSGWGVILVGRLAPNFFYRQAAWMILGTGAMLGASLVGESLRWLRRFRYTWLLGGLLLLAATLVLGVNPSGTGPRLWLGWGRIYFQPSEPLKLLMVVYLASYLAERRDLLITTARRIGNLRLPPLAYVGPLLGMFGLTVLLLAWQEDLGTAMIFFFTFLILLYIATNQWAYAVVGLALFILAGGLGYTISARVAVRVDGWLNPWVGAADRTFQIVQSLLAFGAGGVMGQGPGLGRPTYIPAVHTDFVFAAVTEEFGLLGALAVLALYAVLMARGFRAAARTRRSFESLLAAGLTAGLTIQAWVIIAGNAKLAPIAGVTLPFLSYGGSSLISTFIALGLLMRISSRESTAQDLKQWITPSPRRPLGRPMFYAACVLGAGLVILAIACGYWSVGRARWLANREDNPRRVEYEQRIVRGRILDRNGDPIADVEVGPSGLVTRTYPVPEAAPVVGYASLRHGTGGLEAAFDEQLRGEAGRSAWAEAWMRLLHRPSQGHDLKTTLDADLQVRAQRVLSGQMGALVLLDAETGEILAMGSAPTFNPARLDVEWDQLRENPAAPLLNRVTQGLYQPGAALETVVLAEAVDQEEVSLITPAQNLTATLSVDGAEIACVSQPSEGGDLVAAYRAACPGPFSALGDELGEAGLTRAVSDWALTEPPTLELSTEAGSWSPEDPALEAVGQGSLTVSPLHMALVAGTLANRGTMPAPHLVLQLEGQDGAWRALEAPGAPREELSSELARRMLLAWQPYGAQTLGHLGLAVAGERRPPHAWFLGVAPACAPRYAVAVLLEHPVDPNQAQEVGVAVLEAALEQ